MKRWAPETGWSSGPERGWDVGQKQWKEVWKQIPSHTVSHIEISFIHYSRVRKEKQNIKSVLGPHLIRLSWQSCQNIVLHSNFNSFKQKWTVLSADNLLLKSSLSTLQRKMRTLPGNDTMPNSQQGVRLEKRTKNAEKGGRNHSRGKGNITFFFERGQGEGKEMMSSREERKIDQVL